MKRKQLGGRKRKDVIQLKDTNTNTIERGNEMAFDRSKYEVEYKKKNFDQLKIVIPKGKKEELKEMAAGQGKEMSTFIRDALYYYMDALGVDRIDLG